MIGKFLVKSILLPFNSNTMSLLPLLLCSPFIPQETCVALALFHACLVSLVTSYDWHHYDYVVPYFHQTYLEFKHFLLHIDTSNMDISNFRLFRRMSLFSLSDTHQVQMGKVTECFKFQWVKEIIQQKFEVSDMNCTGKERQPNSHLSFSLKYRHRLRPHHRWWPASSSVCDLSSLLLSLPVHLDHLVRKFLCC